VITTMLNIRVNLRRRVSGLMTPSGNVALSVQLRRIERCVLLLTGGGGVRVYPFAADRRPGAFEFESCCPLTLWFGESISRACAAGHWYISETAALGICQNKHGSTTAKLDRTTHMHNIMPNQNFDPCRNGLRARLGQAYQCKHASM
jgi:hypothetical protein